MSKGTESRRVLKEHIDEENENAPFVALARGLGITETPIETNEQRLSTAIANALREAGAETMPNLRAILMAKIGPMLHEASRPEELSMLDIPTTGLTDDTQIRAYLRKKGIDLDNKDDLEYARQVCEESIGFLEDDIGVKGVRKSFEQKHPTQIFEIFKAAAGQRHKMLIPKACALLRIMAVTHFMNCDPSISLLPKAEEKLKELLSAHIKKDDHGFIYRTRRPGDLGIRLTRRELRTKTRKRIIAKLLHKPSNRAEEVLDHVGVRLTTTSAVDTLKLIYLLFFDPENAIFPSINIRVGETENRLFDQTMLEEALRGDSRKARNLVTKLAEDTIDHEELTTIDEQTTESNPHSHKRYKAIHITFDLPVKTDDGYHRLFPVEVQILDTKSSKSNAEEAPHEGYVEKQKTHVRNRILRNNLLTTFKNKES